MNANPRTVTVTFTLVTTLPNEDIITPLRTAFGSDLKPVVTPQTAHETHHVADAVWDDYDDDETCPNCQTPWKCNGPHIPAHN